jgi:DNA adenine methylase
MAISYIGGKFRISGWIKTFIPKDIEIYTEPCSGMFWVFLKMDLKNYPNLKTVVYNDYNNLNSNLFRCIKDYDKLWDELNKYSYQQLDIVDTPIEHSELFYKCQKEVFNSELIIDDSPNFDIASKYVIVLCQVFSGSKPETSSFIDYKGKYRSKVLIFMDKLKNSEYRKHFDKITFVENMDFQEVIEKYDSEKAFHYCDLPYWKTENYYSNHDFNSDDHKRFADCIKKIKGKFAISYYEFPQLLEWYPKNKYRWESKGFAKAAAAKEGVKQNIGTELLIMNYNPSIYS